MHAENGAILEHCTGLMVSAGRTDARSHAESRPPLAEHEAVSRLLCLAEQTGTRVHVPHVTLASVAGLIGRAKARGLSVSAETCPQYLLLDETELDRQGPYAKCSPPLRTRYNVEQLWSSVLNGTIDYHVSDHAPYATAEKERGWADIGLAPNGLSSNQFALPLVLDEAYHRRGMTLEHFARYSATNAAWRLGLFPRKGTIRVGADADLVFYDLEHDWTIDRAEQPNLHQWTPWHGRHCGVRVRRTLVRGETLYDGQAITVGPGFGRFVTPRYGTAGIADRSIGRAQAGGIPAS